MFVNNKFDKNKNNKTVNSINKKKREKNTLDKSSKKFKEKINEIKNKDIRDSLSQLLDIAKK